MNKKIAIVVGWGYGRTEIMSVLLGSIFFSALSRFDSASAAMAFLAYTQGQEHFLFCEVLLFDTTAWILLFFSAHRRTVLS